MLFEGGFQRRVDGHGDVVDGFEDVWQRRDQGGVPEEGVLLVQLKQNKTKDWVLR